MKLLIGISAVLMVLSSCSSSKTESSPTPAAATGTPAPASSITVNLVEWSIVTSAEAGKAGKITFAVKDAGKVAHEFVIFKTDLAIDKLPLGADGAVDEDKLENAGEGGDLEVGQSKTSTFDLKPGKYVFVCNRVDKQADGTSDIHYKLGMRTAFTVV
jgi:uncharacterized cupredoxin-like copper-binding protein